jgi:hypothetical protein
MPVIDQIIRAIQASIDELLGEIERLRRALAALTSRESGRTRIRRLELRRWDYGAAAKWPRRQRVLPVHDDRRRRRTRIRQRTPPLQAQARSSLRRRMAPDPGEGLRRANPNAGGGPRSSRQHAPSSAATRSSATGTLQRGLSVPNLSERPFQRPDPPTRRRELERAEDLRCGRPRAGDPAPGLHRAVASARSASRRDCSPSTS